MSYKDDLRHPFWQKKRSELLRAANWRCQECGNQHETLEVHHIFYQIGVKPWEYPDSLLLVLCSTHHKIRQEIEQKLLRNIGEIIRGLLISELKRQPIWTMFDSDEFQR